MPTTTFKGYDDFLSVAGQEASAMGHGYIGQEHLLLALLSGPDGTAARALSDLGVDIRAEVEAVVRRGEGASEEQGVTPRASKALQSAVAEARSQGRDHLTGSDVLLGILGSGEGVGFWLLQRRGLTLERVRDALEGSGRR